MDKGTRFKAHGHTDDEQKTSWSLVPDKGGPYVYDPDHEFPAQPPTSDQPCEKPCEQPVPEGYEKMDAYSNGKNLIILGVPRDDSDHNCDAMGCGTLDHVIAIIPLIEVDWSGPIKAPS